MFRRLASYFVKLIPKVNKLGNAVRQGNYGVALHLALCIGHACVHLLMFCRGLNVSDPLSVSIPRGKLPKFPTELRSISRAGIIHWKDICAQRGFMCCCCYCYYLYY